MAEILWLVPTLPACCLQVKVICSSGGHFMRTASGSFEYEGGETRLVSVANFCSFRVLLDALERITGIGNMSGSSAGSQDLVRF